MEEKMGRRERKKMLSRRRIPPLQRLPIPSEENFP